MQGSKKGLIALVAVAGALFGAPAAHGATIDVTTTTDEGIDPGTGCAFREAIEAANQNTDIGGCDTGVEVTGAYGTGTTADTILLDAATYDLTMPGAGEDLNGGGDVDVFGGGAVTIVGAGKAATFVQTALNDRIIDMHAGNELRLEDLTVRDGDAFAFGSQSGGNIRANTAGVTVSIEDMAITGGRGTSGGGILVGGAGSKLVSTGVDVIGNEAETTGGGIQLGAGSSAEITRTAIRTNKAEDDDSGAQARGGGLNAFASGSLTITDSSFAGNEVLGTDPGQAMNGFVLGGGANISGDGPLLIKGTTFSGNKASNDGATEREEGGALNYSGNNSDARIVNSTFHGNIAGDAGSPEGTGGAVHYDTAAIAGNLSLIHVTLKDNEAIGPGGDQVHRDEVSAAPVTLVASILTSAAPDQCFGPNVSGGGNVADPDADCGFGAADSTSGGPIGLAAMPQQNGGPTPTIALDPSGRAVDFVPAALCSFTGGVDQRGTPRPNGPRCDAGAYEAVSPFVPPVANPGPGVVTQQPTAPKCKKPRKKKGKKAGAAKRKKPKGCKKKRRKKK